MDSLRSFQETAWKFLTTDLYDRAEPIRKFDSEKNFPLITASAAGIFVVHAVCSLAAKRFVQAAAWLTGATIFVISASALSDNSKDTNFQMNIACITGCAAAILFKLRSIDTPNIPQPQSSPTSSIDDIDDTDDIDDNESIATMDDEEDDDEFQEYSGTTWVTAAASENLLSFENLLLLERIPTLPYTDEDAARDLREEAATERSVATLPPLTLALSQSQPNQ